ncbi:MAG: hypothetical protein A2358_03245 [Candidatus Staskawiczbacteria bacterium RIFOXYB1_FULL_37_44]|uniref:Uncharacterized protein n=1 Tax=Candidatus Staskawiczbacteria bacterium RIFOXYB1_FULL_37_44 TaxID=1802223 RepID=A0A1G2IWN4_9BACT|nr:MAG: hypothetical protein A2358_03245 [Candidatus Staskawiczbacteria bacterium RIFOXYB1_FULL_37_44]OGZ84180.1 MAG: hypothetical protein A2416_00845 [Candidatus Staskawiczbacteria bacterium RIFOXYC1_FULL_37_52]OGZ86844.1 MAG: hypothetical protein A2444_02910 [Candidatus Staskawiczbacteria bacterium RIFOXYC2_FULL_37_19]OGZ89258.1 MAG: hypothetical protein A2581_04200 [Candidatus Staskawiczbacteria bacterium RIFOXYD1_FULL_37_110]
MGAQNEKHEKLLQPAVCPPALSAFLPFFQLPLLAQKLFNDAVEVFVRFLVRQEMFPGLNKPVMAIFKKGFFDEIARKVSSR